MGIKSITNHIKIVPPRVPNILPRPRLMEQISKNQDKRLLFILGQAAQGKSTLAATYAGTLEVPVAWLNLDEGDSDPVNLFYWLIDAFQHVLPDRDLSFLRSYPSMSRGAREPTLLSGSGSRSCLSRSTIRFSWSWTAWTACIETPHPSFFFKP